MLQRHNGWIVDLAFQKKGVRTPIVQLVSLSDFVFLASDVLNRSIAVLLLWCLCQLITLSNKKKFKFYFRKNYSNFVKGEISIFENWFNSKIQWNKKTEKTIIAVKTDTTREKNKLKNLAKESFNLYSKVSGRIKMYIFQPHLRVYWSFTSIYTWVFNFKLIISLPRVSVGSYGKMICIFLSFS